MSYNLIAQVRKLKHEEEKEFVRIAWLVGEGLSQGLWVGRCGTAQVKQE